VATALLWIVVGLYFAKALVTKLTVALALGGRDVAHPGYGLAPALC
jgi:hypothetical protein